MGCPISEGISAFEEARCGLTGCGQPLHLIWSSSHALYLSDDMLRFGEPFNLESWTWHVECEGGHTILLPPDNGDDCHQFGLCTCNPDYPDDIEDALCQHRDGERLRAVVASPSHNSTGSTQ